MIRLLLALLTVTTVGFAEERFTFSDGYDWFNDMYYGGWYDKRGNDLFVNPYAHDPSDATIRGDITVAPSVRLYGKAFTKGGHDLGLSLRAVKSKEFSLDIEPSFLDGRIALFAYTRKYGFAGPIRFGSKVDWRQNREGLMRGIMTNVLLKRTSPPKEPLGQVAEHVLARGMRRLVLGVCNPVVAVIGEALGKRFLRRFNRAFDKFFGGKKTKGLTVAKQTLADPP